MKCEERTPQCSWSRVLSEPESSGATLLKQLRLFLGAWGLIFRLVSKDSNASMSKPEVLYNTTEGRTWEQSNCKTCDSQTSASSSWKEAFVQGLRLLGYRKLQVLSACCLLLSMMLPASSSQGKISIWAQSLVVPPPSCLLKSHVVLKQRSPSRTRHMHLEIRCGKDSWSIQAVGGGSTRRTLLLTASLLGSSLQISKSASAYLVEEEVTDKVFQLAGAQSSLVLLACGTSVYLAFSWTPIWQKRYANPSLHLSLLIASKDASLPRHLVQILCSILAYFQLQIPHLL